MQSLFFRIYIQIVSKCFLRIKIRMIKASGLFNEEDYIERYPDVSKEEIDPITHYLLYGVSIGRHPGANFEDYFEVDHLSGSHNIGMLKHLVKLIFDKDYIVKPKPGFEVINNLRKRYEKPIPVPQNTEINLDDIYVAYKNMEEEPDYEKEVLPEIPPSNLKMIAFYLPQYHPFKENDKFWGKGFTEWTNTTKARPLYKGHYQPRLPGELGFYDTRLKEVLQRQIELAKQYGIYGFCFHHYFFDGKPVMRVPYEQIINNKDLDIPFCIHWANEPWTAKFDGYTDRGGVLLEQNHYPKDDIAFFRDIETALHDERYITVEGKPLLIVYRPGLFPDFKATVERWREESIKSGLKGMYIAMVETIFEGVLDPETYGVDAVVEFPPHYIRHRDVIDKVPLFDADFKGEIYSYPEVVYGEIERKNPDYTLFRGIFPQWDNTARRRDPKIFFGAEPGLYQQWLEHIIKYTENHLPIDKQMIFINAWNEWAEAAYIEPDYKYGYTYLNATARALNNAIKR